jgi:glycosyltransferase involved in cell wall biosynthesis
VRILYLSMDPGVHLSSSAGGAVHIRGFVRALAELGHDVTVVATSAGGKTAGAKTVPVPVAPWNRALARPIAGINAAFGRTRREHPDLVRILHDRTSRRVLDRCARSLHPEVIYERSSLWGTAGAAVAARHRVPLVLEVNAPLADEQERFRGLSFPALARFTERRVWRSASLVVVVSEILGRHLESAGVPPHRILVAPNGVDPGIFHPAADGKQVRARLGIGGKFVIGATGTFKPWHGMDLLVEAFRHICSQGVPAHLLLVGDGPGRDRLAREVRRSELEHLVSFTGNVAHEEIPAYLAAMDVAVAASPRLDEQYFSPLKLFEYMATARAIVASRSGQAPQVLTDGVSALLFEPGDTIGLGRSIRRLYDDPALAERLRQGAAAASRAYTWRNNAVRVLEKLGRPKEHPVA